MCPSQWNYVILVGKLVTGRQKLREDDIISEESKMISAMTACVGKKCRLNTWTLVFLWQHLEIVRVFVRQLLVSPRSRHSRQEAKSHEWGLQSEHPDVLGYSSSLWQEHSGDSKWKCGTFDLFPNLLKIFANYFPLFWFLWYLRVWYLPVQRSQITIKGVYYDEKPAVLHFQVVHVITFGMIIKNHFQKWHIVRIAVSQSPEIMEWKRDDELEILSRQKDECCIQRAKLVSNTFR